LRFKFLNDLFKWKPQYALASVLSELIKVHKCKLHM